MKGNLNLKRYIVIVYRSSNHKRIPKYIFKDSISARDILLDPEKKFHISDTTTIQI